MQLLNKHRNTTHPFHEAVIAPLDFLSSIAPLESRPPGPHPFGCQSDATSRVPARRQPEPVANSQPPAALRECPKRLSPSNSSSRSDISDPDLNQGPGQSWVSSADASSAQESVLCILHIHVLKRLQDDETHTKWHWERPGTSQHQQLPRSKVQTPKVEPQTKETQLQHLRSFRSPSPQVGFLHMFDRWIVS